eukprot:gene14399-19330_t
MSVFGYMGVRRESIYLALKERGINITNVYYGSYMEEKNVFDSAQILVNVHQTPNHLVPEEYRIIPALTRGV